MKNKILRAALALLLACALLPTGAPARALSLFGSDDGIVQSTLEDDGVLRVYLKSLGDPQNLTLTLAGVYTVEHDAGFRFARNTEIVLSDSGDTIYLCVGGLTLDMGDSLTLTRQASDEAENGIYIAESEKDNLYVGDLTVTRNDGGGLRPVLSIQMEDYLCGVVAYEMSDSWPLEALKAQAVAARTYAMQRKWNAGDRDYDLVDTTADQVYKGYDPQYTNVLQAVEETAGVVGTYNGGFATCYYTASNGGTVALPSDVWSGDGDYGYLMRRDDPYDLANPNSLVTSLHFSRKAEGSPKLKAMLLDAADEALAEQGIEDIRIEEVLSVTPAEEKVEGSRMYTKLRFSLKLSYSEMVYIAAEGDIGAPMPATDSAAANQVLFSIDYLRRLRRACPFELGPVRRELAEPVEVELDVYGQIKDELDLGLNGSNYELVSVVEEGDGYTIELRRFGHGVGMSQRGAQRMAGVEEMSCTEILKFYYPGMTLEKIDWDAPELEELEALPESVGRARAEPTPTPTPAPLPELEDGPYYAVVQLGDASSTLNLRQAPTTQSQVVAQLASGRRLIVCGEADGEGWVQVRTAEYEGYVKLEYLKAE